ncbi:MAG: NAD(P)/FAD-dependent oxidoreductase [Planctomycetes bacterium]|nr:NAD(P)/FAD-dependent oxidoreductase [Planctomycetota bacterium]
MRENYEVDLLIAGAGVVGLAVAAACARRGRQVYVVESEAGFGRHASSRNSEVLHAGFYYEPGSEKARHCREGRRLFLERARRLGIPHRLCGKLVVAADDRDCDRLERLLARGHANEVPGLELIGREELARLEPQVRGVAALHSRETGIIDSHALMASLVAEVEEQGGTIVYEAPARIIAIEAEGVAVEVGGREPLQLRPRSFVNAAGAGASALARDFRHRGRAMPDVRLVRGHYLDYAGPSPFRHLVYPLPVRDGLGIHATLDLEGRLRFGPDTQAVTTIDYRMPEDLAATFAAAIRDYWPGLDPSRLGGGYCGLRTKIVTAEDWPADFVISGPEDHGVAGVVHLLGIESPGLTAALSLAEEVGRVLG